MKLAITICATKNYCYAMQEQARRLQSNLAGIEPGHILLVGDDSEELKAVADLYRKLLPKWDVQVVSNPGLTDDHENYKESAQLLIGRMRQAAFDAVRTLDADLCWSLDSDVLPPTNALRCMMTMLEFDAGWYSISTCPYPSQSGAGFLGGRGTPHRHILPDFYEDEREIPAELATKLKELRDFLAVPRIRSEVTPELEKVLQGKAESLREAEKELDKCPPKGNVWTLNGTKWRQRGWLDNAYPGVGLGAVLPSDWCGFGCTLMNRAALALAHFDGYEGKGTEDLYIIWRRWQPAGLRINVIPHCPCDHVVRDKQNKGQFIHAIAYHEPLGETAGHLRVRHQPFVTTSLPQNDAQPPLTEALHHHPSEP